MTQKKGPRNLGHVDMAAHATLTPAAPGDELVTVSVGPAGEAVAVWAAAGGTAAMHGRTESPDSPSFPNPRTEQPVSTRIVTYRPQPEREIAVQGVKLAFPMVQPLPGDRTLIVGARCRRRPEGPERNAVIVDADGERVASGTLGDGIEEVLTTPSGQIWVGYFDEGIFGNFGWGGPGPTPIGAPGIVRFGPGLTQTWQYPADAEGGLMADAYALNVDGETAWSSYYTDFPIVRIAADEVTTWHGGAAGVRALIVEDDRCALIGGTHNGPHRFLVGSLGSGAFVAKASGTLTLPGRGRPDRCRWVGRGAELHAFAEDRWYKISLGDLTK